MGKRIYRGANNKMDLTKFDDVLMDSAFLWASLSTCNRRQVGCVIAKDSRILSTGYNGTISGMDNCCEDVVEKCRKCPNCTWDSSTNMWYASNSDVPIDTCPTCDNERKVVYKTETTTKDSVLHAEQNALMFALKNGIRTQGSTLYCTDAPCVTCAKLIAQSGVRKVFYARDYRDTSGLDLLQEARIPIQKLIKD
jgi:dCMP deaminase